jgi:hypothetical protein
MVLKLMMIFMMMMIGKMSMTMMMMMKMMFMKITISTVMTITMIKNWCQKVMNFCKRALLKSPNYCLFKPIFRQFMFSVYSLEYYTVVRDMKAVKCQIKNFTT